MAGVVAGLLGVGGGIVTVPAIYSVLGLVDVDPAVRMHIAVGTSLALIVPTSLRSARAHHRRGAVDVPLLKAWAWPLVLGVIGGVLIAAWVDSATLSLLFAAIVLLMALYLSLPQRAASPQPPAQQRAAILTIPLLTGLLSTLMGIGGGTLSVPAMSALGYPVHRAVGTSAAFGTLIALPGSVGLAIAGWNVPGLPPLSLGYVNLLAFACLLPTTLLAVPAGVSLAHRLSARLLRFAFVAFLLLIGGRMLWAAL